MDVGVVGLKPDVLYFISGELLELLHIIERCPSLSPIFIVCILESSQVMAHTFTSRVLAVIVTC